MNYYQFMNAADEGGICKVILYFIITAIIFIWVWFGTKGDK